MKTRVKCMNIIQGIFSIKYALLIFLFLTVTTNFAQNLTDVARSKELTWYGVDYTQARFVGFSDKDLPDSLISRLSYTSLSKSDYKMIKKSYGKFKMIVETSMANKRNGILYGKSLIYNKTYEIGIDIIKKVVAEYNIKDKGFGILCIVESFERINNSVFVWIVFIDNTSGNIISTRRYIGNIGYSDYNYKSDLDSYWKKGIKQVIKLSGLDLRLYK